MAGHSDDQCILSTFSNCIGVLGAFIFLLLFVWKLWFTKRAEDKVIIFHLDKPVFYSSYLFFILSVSTFTLNTMYLLTSCYSIDTEDHKFRFDTFLILWILSESAFKSIFSLLMIFQLFHAFKGLHHALNDMNRFILMLFVGIQFFIEILYDINLSFTDSKWNRLLPAIYLFLDFSISLSVATLFLHKLALSVNDESVNHFQSAAVSEVDELVNLQHSQRSARRRIVFCCITAMVARSIYLTVVIADELIFYDENFDAMYSMRSWISMLCIMIQSVCVLLLFPFGEEWYQCLCAQCIKCCGAGRHRRSVENYEQL